MQEQVVVLMLTTMENQQEQALVRMPVQLSRQFPLRLCHDSNSNGVKLFIQESLWAWLKTN
jgi:hypothetical protein